MAGTTRFGHRTLRRPHRTRRAPTSAAPRRSTDRRTVDTRCARSRTTRAGGRLVHGADGDRLLGPAVVVARASPLVLLVITRASRCARSGLNLGIDFEGGVVVGRPGRDASRSTTPEAILDDNGLDATRRKIQERSSDSGDIIKVQVDDQPARGPRCELQEAFAEAAGVEPARRQRRLGQRHAGARRSPSKAIRALVVFLVLDRPVHLVPLRVADGARRRSSAMIHDVVDQRRHLLGVRLRGHAGDGRSPSSPSSATRCTTPSSCSTGSARTSGASPPPALYGRRPHQRVDEPGADALDQHDARRRSLPVLSLLLVGAGLFGQVTLREFAIALLVGMITGAYSSIFVAAPLLGWLKSPIADSSPDAAGAGDAPRRRRPAGRRRSPGRRRRRRSPRRRRRRGAPTARRAADAATAAPPPSGDTRRSAAERLLTHPPRPRKKKRR